MEIGEVLKTPEKRFTLREAAKTIVSSIEEITGKRPGIPGGRRADTIKRRLFYPGRRMNQTEEQKALYLVRFYLQNILTVAKNRALNRAGKEYWDSRQRAPSGAGPIRYDQSHMGAIFDEFLEMTGDTEPSLLVRDNLRRIGVSKVVLNAAETKLFL